MDSSKAFKRWAKKVAKMPQPTDPLAPEQPSTRGGKENGGGALDLVAAIRGKVGGAGGCGERGVTKMCRVRECRACKQPVAGMKGGDKGVQGLQAAG